MYPYSNSCPWMWEREAVKRFDLCDMTAIIMLIIEIKNKVNSTPYYIALTLYGPNFFFVVFRDIT